jgi:hypothetical protein
MGNLSFTSVVMWGNILNQNSDMNFWEVEIQGLCFSISKIFGFNRSTTPRDSLLLFSISSKYIGQEITETVYYIQSEEWENYTHN